MSELESIAKLRKLKGEVVDYRWGVDFDRAIDALDAEIAERFMERPVDADGVPIRVGDTLRYVDFYVKAAALTQERVYWWDECGECHWFNGEECRHAKPRTIEDVLRDMVTLCANTWKDEKSAFRYYDVDNVMESGNIADFADEIRAMFGEVDHGNA